MRGIPAKTVETMRARVVAVAGQVVDDDLGVGKGFGEMGAKLFDRHGQGRAVSG